MAMAMAALLILLLAAPAVHAVQHNIPWSQGTNYAGSTYSSQTYTVGDTLLFTYGGSHGVDVVTQSDYDNCNSGNALNSYSGGQTTITLSSAGPMYFMCPTSGHCQSGMKLGITVVSAASTTTPSTGTSPAVTTPSSSSSSGSSSSDNPSPSGTTPVITTTTSSPTSGAGGMFGNMNYLVMMGFSVVVAGLVGFMG
ncbi:hypothetical protein Vadar_018174 [Vaccinium darrowii]|uniref:Uncharacterized protein n=1 Tax=Vaccinium darrowii TaxID=229202 RepID=A0ACB7ZDG1_9ERIC|nr:hypothetical protein Vadar_018174 [Vaccinium darrowii]